jgi:hypothetical protein
MIANYRQQTPPHLGFYSSSRKGWITLGIIPWQDINSRLFLSHTCTVGFKVSTKPFWAVEEWNSLKQSPFSLLNPVTWSFFIYFRNKNLAYLLLHMAHSIHSLYVVFVDSHWGIYDGCLESYSIKAYMELKVFQGYSLLTLHVLPGQTGILGGEFHTLRSRGACVWIYLVANLNSTLLLK